MSGQTYRVSRGAQRGSGRRAFGRADRQAGGVADLEARRALHTRSRAALVAVTPPPLPPPTPPAKAAHWPRLCSTLFCMRYANIQPFQTQPYSLAHLQLPFLRK